MKQRTPFTAVATPPAKRGFYEAELKDGRRTIAQWTQFTAAHGNQWFEHVSDDPTVEKAPVLLEGVRGWRKVDQAVVAEALKREPTVPERIEAALKQFASHTDIQVDLLGPPPERRALAVGDGVEIGNLRDCKVVALRQEGRVVVLSYHNVGRKQGEEVDYGIAYRAAHWTQVLPLKGMSTVDRVRNPAMHGGWFSTTLSALLGMVSAGLDDNPTYQRGYAWSDEDNASLLNSLFNGREIGRFLLVTNKYPKLNEILDGKQRLHCVWLFFTSQIAYEGVYWHELTPRDRNRIETRMVQFVELDSEHYTRAELLEVFLAVNTGGVPQTEEHLQAVRDALREELLRNPVEVD